MGTYLEMEVEDVGKRRDEKAGLGTYYDVLFENVRL